MHELLQFPVRENLSNILASAPAEIQPFPASAEVVARQEDEAAEEGYRAFSRLVAASKALDRLFDGVESLDMPLDVIDFNCPVVREFRAAAKAKEL